MPRNSKSKKITPDDDLDLMGDFGDDESGGISADDESATDSLFDNYFRPETPEDPDPDAEENFIEATDLEHALLGADFEQADAHQVEYTKSVLKENKNAAGSGVDPYYFFCVVFVSEEQRDAFIHGAGWERYGGTRMLNGVKMAHEMGIELPDAYLAVEAKPDKSLSEFVRKE